MTQPQSSPLGNLPRRTLLKGIGAAGLSLAYAGKVSASEDGEDIQYLVVGDDVTDAVERAGFTVKRELAGGEVLTVIGPEGSEDDLREIGAVDVAEPDAKFEIDLQDRMQQLQFDGENLEDVRPKDEDDERDPVERGLDWWEDMEMPDAHGLHDVSAGDDEPAPSWPNQWDKQVSDVDEAHDYATGEGSTIAVIDTGILPTHPDLEDNINVEDSALFESALLPCFLDPWDVEGHGTHVAGIAAASPGFDDHPSVIGTAPDAELVSIRVFWLELCFLLVTTTSDILAGIDHAAEVGADAANLSLGTDPIPPEANADGVRVAYEKVIQHATRQGTVVVASAGNSEANLQQGGYFTTPNSTAGAMSISSSDPADGLSEYSNFGTNEIDVGAPGGLYEDPEMSLCAYEEWLDAGEPALITDDPREPGETGTLWLDADGEPTANEGQREESIDCEIPEWPYPFNLVFNTYMDPFTFAPTWSWLAGTSMAAPQVSGLAALVRELDPDANANQVESAIKHGCEGANGRSDPALGAGRLNALKTVEWVDD